MNHQDDEDPADDPLLTAPTYSSGQTDNSNRIDATLCEALATEPDATSDPG